MLLLQTFFLLLLPLLALAAQDYYALLNVPKSASDKDLRSAYRKLSKQYHPDKNPGNEEAAKKFVEISDAYDTLTTPELRKMYDQHGADAVKKHKESGGREGPNAQNPFDIFARFFGGHGHFGGSGERRGPNQEVRIAVPLRDFYRGGEASFTVERQGICETCDGSGSQDGKMATCGECGGRGMVVQKLMLAPGIFQQAQSACGACGGQGQVIKSRCKVCGGQRVVRQQEKFTVSVEPGAPKGHRVILENEADAHPDYVAGDLAVVLMEMEPEHVRQDEDKTDGTFFRRKDANVLWREALSLREAWMGDWSRNVTHLDGHVVRLGRKRGEVVQPGQVDIVTGEGMPVWKEEEEARAMDDVQYGNLIVEYVVILPDQMEKGMEKDFHAVFEKWRGKKGKNLAQDIGRPFPTDKGVRDEL